MVLDLSPLNLDKDATEIWVAKGENLSLADPKVYTRKNYNHNTIHVHNPNSANVTIYACNYLADTSPEDHFQALTTFTTDERIVLSGKLGYFYVEADDKVWIHVLSGQREQR